ncbi:hypothetical protein, partial [Arthrobacter sp. RAF14]|uniref:hypothetical protein n=1 Tax=Arthrobacter sp. RAF14 TaxID=3233051 RepID=UPI003F8EB2C8
KPPNQKTNSPKKQPPGTTKKHPEKELKIKGIRIEDRHQNQHNRPGNPIYSTHPEARAQIRGEQVLDLVHHPIRPH